MTRCYLALGSNLSTPIKQIRLAIQKLRCTPGIQLLKTSSLYFSRPFGVSWQPTYCNAVAMVATTLSPNQLLATCQQLEYQQHRVRRRRFGSRTLDIDILLYGDKVIQTHNLIVPHPAMKQRDFVLVPLTEIAPTLTFPSGEYVASYLSNCDPHIRA